MKKPLTSLDLNLLLCLQLLMQERSVTKTAKTDERHAVGGE